MSAQKTPPHRRRQAPTLATLRSAVSNGSRLLPDLDHRSGWARRLRDLISDHVSDLGGEDQVSSAEAVLVRRAAMLTLQLELMEQRWAANNDGEAGPKSLMMYQRGVNTLRRTLETLGLSRRARDITPDPLSYAREFDRRKAEDAEVVV
jgi:hypothetical protein